MGELRSSRGVPLPSAGSLVFVAAALVATWLVWSRFGRVADDGDFAGKPVKGLHAVEAQLNRGTDAIPDLLAALDSDDPNERRLAAYGLGRIGHMAEAALEKLRQRLADDDPRVRENAAYAVANVDPDKSAAAAAIAPLMDDPQQSVRESVENDLLDIGAPAFETLLAMQRAESAARRLDVLRIFRKALNVPYTRGWGDQSTAMLQAVRELLTDPDAAVRIEAQTLLAEWRQATVAEIGELLRSGDARRIGVALTAAASKKDEAAELLPDMLVLLDRGLDGPILLALKSLRAAARSAAPRLIELSETARSSDRFEIAQTLVEIDADPDDSGRILSSLLLVENKRGPPVAWRAGELLLKVNPAEAHRQVSLLLPRLQCPDGTVEFAVLYALHTLGPQAGEAVPALIPLLQSPESKIAEFAAHALDRSGPAGVAAVPALVAIVVNPSKSDALRTDCANALASIGDGAQSAVPALLKLVAQSEPDAWPRTFPEDFAVWRLREALVTALGRIGGSDPGLVPALRSQLQSRSHDVHAAAAEALGRVASQSPEVLALLIPLLEADMPIVRVKAALAISRSTVDRQSAVAPLIRALSDENPHVRLAAAIALGSFGPAARDALPVLRERLTVPFDSGSNGNNGSQYLNIPELNRLSFEQAVRTAIDEIDVKSNDVGRGTEK